jgi:hypothetical protein
VQTSGQVGAGNPCMRAIVVHLTVFDKTIPAHYIPTSCKRSANPGITDFAHASCFREVEFATTENCVDRVVFGLVPVCSDRARSRRVANLGGSVGAALKACRPAERSRVGH